MPLFLASYFHPWVASLVVAGVLVILVTLCACQGEKETRCQDFGIPGKLSSIAIDTIPQQHGEGDYMPKSVENHNGRPVSALTESSASSDGKPRTVTERALPDIPRAVQQPSFDTDTDQTPDSGSECYATVTKKDAVENGGLSETHQVLQQTHVIPLSPSNTSPLQERVYTPSSEPSTSQDLTVPNGSPGIHTYAQVRKSTNNPYSRLSESGDSEITDNYQVAQEELNHQELLLPNAHSEETPSNGILSERNSSAPFIAGQAVAGNIPSAEIPYMTPPLAMSTAQMEMSDLALQQEVPYTVISVREPLERVRMQTRQRMRKRQHSQQCSSTEEPEGYYMEVPDDEQTYAEIDSGQNSAESSSTYDLIEQRASDFPPDPPTVESLKSVAKAHSRQASIASVSSFGSTAAAEFASKDNSTLNCMIEKSKKNNSTSNSASTSDSTHGPSSINLEDLYAKVHKKRIEGTLSVSGIEEVLRLDANVDCSDDVFASARTSWSSTATSHVHIPPVLPPSNTNLLTLNKTLVRRHSAEPSFSESNGQARSDEEPSYALVKHKIKQNDPDYEQIKRQEPSYAQVRRTHKNSDNIVEPGYERIKKTRDDSDVIEPGYESIRRTQMDNDIEPGYERIKRGHADSETEPGYELIGRTSLSDTFDPGYECVRNIDQNSSDPGYERVPKIGRSESDAVDPGYESVRRVKRETDRSDPDYECIPFTQAGNDSDSMDPGYEQVKKSNISDFDMFEPGYEQVGFTQISERNERHSVDRYSIPGPSMDNHLVKSSSSDSEDSVFNIKNPVYEFSTSEPPPTYNDSFVCDKISLNVPFSDALEVAPENFVTVRVRQSSGSESSVSYSTSIIEVETDSKPRVLPT